MDRRDFFARSLALALVPAATTVASRAVWAENLSDGGARSIPKLDKPRSEWKRILTPAQFAVLREEDTERPFSSALNHEKREGTYVCAGCNLPLFTSDAKFDSGTGWPSFFRPIRGHVATKRDWKMILPRTEYHCARCGGHQGHIFNDGPEPTGKRYCNNGVALRFAPGGQSLPALLT